MSHFHMENIQYMHLSLGPHRRRHAGQPEFPLLARGTHPAAASAGKGSHFSFTRELNSIDSAALVGELEVKVKQKLMEHLKGWSCARHGICAPKHISCGSSQNYTWPEIVFLGSFSLSLSLSTFHTFLQSNTPFLNPLQESLSQAPA